MTTSEPAPYPVYTETTLDAKGMRHSQTQDLTEVPNDILVMQWQHGDPRAADEVHRRAAQAGLDNGDLTQEQFDFLTGLTDTPPPGMDTPPPETPASAPAPTDNTGGTP